MPLSQAQEQKIAELEAGITAAPSSVVANNRSCLLEVFASIKVLKADLAQAQSDLAELASTDLEPKPQPVKANVAL